MTEWQQGTQQPMTPGAQPVPGAPVAQPQPAAYPQQPAAQPAAYPQQPAAYPQQPAAYPQQPAAYPQQPAAQPAAAQPEPTVAYPEPPAGYSLTLPAEQAAPADLPEPPPGYTLTPPDAQPKPGAASAIPLARDINSVSVAIMPGVPLPDWIDRGQLAEILAPALDNAQQYPVVHPVPGFQTADGGVTAGTGLPLPNPAQRNEHPMGPVTWGAPAPATQPQPMSAAAPAAAVAAPVGPPAVEQFDWLLQPESPSYQRIPDYAPPPGMPAVPVPPAGYYLPAATPGAAVDSQTPITAPPAGYYLPTAAAAGMGDSEVPVPPPPEGFYIAAEVNPSVPMGTPIPPPPEGYYVPDTYPAGEFVGAGSR